MKRSRVSRPPLFVALLLMLLLDAGALALAACAGKSTTATASPSPAQPVATISPTQSATPRPTASGPGIIAFTKGTLSGSENMIDSQGIHLIRSDGTGLRLLAADGSHPAWSPDGSKIAYTTRFRGVWVMNADGSDPQQVTTANGWVSGLAWSPDGGQIVFSDVEEKERPGMSTLVVVNADGSGRRQVTAAGHGEPAWAPDGRILFIRGESMVYSVDPDGSGSTVVAAPAASFSLSPDGKWLAIWDRWSDRLERRAASGPGSEVWLVEKVGRFSPPRAFFAVASSWSPDGKKIAFAGDEGPFLAPSALYVVNADGSGLRRVPKAGMGWNPVWQPQ